MIDRLLQYICCCILLPYSHCYNLRKYFKTLTFLVTFILVCRNLVSSVDILYTKEVCDADNYYEPYAKITKSRKGPVIAGVYHSGFLNTRKYSGLLCVNGPSFLYMEMSGNEFIKAEVQLISHGCIVFNRRNSSSYKTGHHQDPIDQYTEVNGAKIYGVYLLAEGKDYRRSQFKWFRHPNFGTKDHETPSDNINGSSFAMVVNDNGKSGGNIIEDPPGPIAYCFKIVSAHIKGKIKGDIKAGDEPKFCYREEDDPGLDFDEVFRKNLAALQYEWPECDPTDPDDGTEPDDSTPSPLPDFRIIDPSMLHPKGSPGKPFKPKVVIKDVNSIPFYSRPFPPGYFFKGEKGYQDPVTENPIPDDETTTPETPIKFVKAETKECEEISKVPDCGNDPDPEEACKLLNHVLTIEEVDWKSNPNLLAAAWRKQIFNLIIKIYQNVCPQVSKQLAPAVSRVLEYFIQKVAVHANTVAAPDPKTAGQKKHEILNVAKHSEYDKTWIPDLERCLKSAEKMPFYRTRDLVNERKKKEIEKLLEEYAKNPKNSNISLSQLEDQLRDVHIMFPYFIWLPPPKSWNNRTQIHIKDVLEAAEIDFNLDWAIDTYWKIISTVWGYCNQHYQFREAANFAWFYGNFSVDVLDLVNEQWTQYAEDGTGGENYIFGNFEKVYDQLFGEFYNGVASRYIDACNIGSYWWSDVPDYIPPRPVYLKRDSTVPINVHRPVNFFIEHPLFRRS